MSLVDSILNITSDISLAFGEVLKTRPQSYCVLNTSDSDTTMSSDDGSLVTVIKLHGSISVVGADRNDLIITTLSESLAPFMDEAGHILQVVFNYDPARAKKDIAESMESAVNTARTLNLDLEGFMEDWVESLSGYCASEDCYLVMWTQPAALSAQAKKEGNREVGKSRLAAPEGRDAQVVGRVMRRLHEVHDGYVNALTSSLDKLELSHTIMDNHDSLLDIRTMICPSLTSSFWRAALPGDPLPMKTPEPLSRKNDYGFMLYPQIGEQIFPDETEDDGNLLISDGLYHAPLLMSMPPQTPKPFNALFRALIRRPNLPWRASMMIDGGGMSSLTFKSALSAVLHLASSDNKKINKAISELNINQLDGDPIVRFRMTLDTWASTKEKAITNRSEVSGAVQAWGSCDVTPIAGDPLLSFSSTIPAIMKSSPGVPAVAPLLGAGHDGPLSMMPFSRPASPWTKGSIPLRTPDGKIMPIAQMSSLQTSWIDMGVAPMGFGKSMWLNLQNLMFCLQSGLTELPYLSIVDIGPSSKGLISLLKACLPPHLRHYAAYHRLRMEKEYAINPFDLPLGNVEPLPSHLSFLVNLVCLFCTPIGKDSPEDGVVGLASAAIMAAYQELAPNMNPKPWTKGVCPDVDKAVEDMAMHTEGLTWYGIMDICFKKNDIHTASIAHRYAVPTLADVAAAAKKDIVSGIYTGQAETKEKITDYFWRSCVDAIKAYPILSMPTAFDLGDARIVALDLDEVAPKGGPVADRQSGVMYMIARHVVGSRFFRMPEDVNNMPDAYQDYHRAAIASIREQPKRISYDEFHRVSRNSAVSAQIVGDIETAVRESRKWNLSIGLYSQSIDDYPPILVNLSSSFFVMGVGSLSEAKTIANYFGLSETSLNAMTRIRKPGKQGSTMLAYMKTSKGNAEQLLSVTMGSQGIWAFSTTSEDTSVRDYLYQKIGVTKTLKLLQKYYPGGVKAELELIMNDAAKRGDEVPKGAKGWVEALRLDEYARLAA